jgi:hypothetical protein
VRKNLDSTSYDDAGVVSCTDVLLHVATAARLFHASDGSGFADLIIDGHRMETWPLRSKRFQAWLRQQYYARTWAAPSPVALNAALNVLEAQAQFDSPQRCSSPPARLTDAAAGAPPVVAAAERSQNAQSFRSICNPALA